MTARIVKPNEAEYGGLDPYNNYGHCGGVIVDPDPGQCDGDWITIGSRRYNVHPPNGVNLHAYGIRWSEAAQVDDDGDDGDDDEAADDDADPRPWYQRVEKLRGDYRRLRDVYTAEFGDAARFEQQCRRLLDSDSFLGFDLRAVCAATATPGDWVTAAHQVLRMEQNWARYRSRASLVRRVCSRF